MPNGPALKAIEAFTDVALEVMQLQPPFTKEDMHKARAFLRHNAALVWLTTRAKVDTPMQTAQIVLLATQAYQLAIRMPETKRDGRPSLCQRTRL